VLHKTLVAMRLGVNLIYLICVKSTKKQ